MLFYRNFAVDLLSPYFSVYFANHRCDANCAHCLPSSPVTQRAAIHPSPDCHSFWYFSELDVLAYSIFIKVWKLYRMYFKPAIPFSATSDAVLSAGCTRKDKCKIARTKYSGWVMLRDCGSCVQARLGHARPSLVPYQFCPRQKETYAQLAKEGCFDASCLHLQQVAEHSLL